MQRGENWKVDLDPTMGHEQQGYRPVLIVSEAAFNRVTAAPIVVPITRGGAFAQRNGFAVPLAGTQTTGLVRCDQVRVVDLQARRGHRVEVAPDDVVDEVLARLVALFE
jgi:mRNA-degrading endonuclease toxin of MazEF toxin-antitoxin module